MEIIFGDLKRVASDGGYSGWMKIDEDVEGDVIKNFEDVQVDVQEDVGGTTSAWV